MVRVVVPMPGGMKDRLQDYIQSDAGRSAGHNEMAQVMKIALDQFLNKKGV